MAVIDAFSFIDYLVSQSIDDNVARLFTNRQSPVRIATANLAEAYDVLIRSGGKSREDIDDRVGRLTSIDALDIVPLTDDLARRAGTLRSVHYDKRRRSVSIADCVAAVTADALEDSLATTDPHLADMAREIGVDVIALPDSSGEAP